jgi:hypothetical protein
MEYVAAFAGIDPEHPFMRRRYSWPETSRIPWQRLSAARIIKYLTDVDFLKIDTNHTDLLFA